MNVLYETREGTMFDSVATLINEMSEQEKQHFMIMLQGYRAGVKSGIRIAKEQQDDERIS